jgi:lipopolysaccharide transport system ATP-binding protein
MADLAIRVEGVGKQYRIGKQLGTYGSLRDTIMNTLKAPLRRARSLLRGDRGTRSDPYDSIWALKDVSFDVSRGEVVGIIGEWRGKKHAAEDTLTDHVADPR